MPRAFDSLILALANALLYLKHPLVVRMYWKKVHRFPNIAHPRTYTERMFWRKVVDHDPRFVVFSDKLATKEFIRRLCPDLALPRTLWVGTDANDIPDDAIAGDVFVKTNHGFNFNYRIRNGQVDRDDLKRKTDRWMKTVHGRDSGQWAYSRIVPKLFVEEAIGDATVDLFEINIRAGNGLFNLGSVIGRNKLPGHWIVYLDDKCRPTPGPNHKDGDPLPSLPDGLDLTAPYQEAVAYARTLSAGVDYARFDFMWNGARLHAGEITIYPAGGFVQFTNPAVAAATLAGWDLSVSHFLTARHRGVKRIYANALKRRLAAARPAARM